MSNKSRSIKVFYCPNFNQLLLVTRDSYTNLLTVETIAESKDGKSLSVKWNTDLKSLNKMAIFIGVV